jgi:hypothetical protein
MPTEIMTQRSTRDEGVFEDQFGRPYLVVWEKKTGDPTGQIDRAHFRELDLNGKVIKETPWDDPLGTPQKYYSVPRNKYGQKEHGHLVCDLVQFATDQKQAMREWTNFLWANAEIEYPSQKPVPAEMERDPLLLRRTGPKPWPSHDVILIAARGVEDKLARQLLGLDVLGAEAKLMLGAPDSQDVIGTYVEQRADAAPVKWTEFVAWAIRTGKATNLKECSALRESLKAQKTA